jgi:hypothetical protein
MRNTILLQILAFFLFWGLFYNFQNESIYNKSLGLVSKNWVNENGERKLVQQPFSPLTNENIIHWDANHYNQIRQYGYDQEKCGGDKIFAFFPLFPYLWSISQLPPIGMIFLNYLLFSISILILLRSISPTANHLQYAALSLSMPSIIIYLIPYTEATFMFCVSLAIAGHIKRSYLLYFLGLLLASITRPSSSILVIAMLCAEMFFLVKHKNLKQAIQKACLRTLPLFVGIAVVSLFQLSQGSGSLFKFIEVQKYWDNVLSVPRKLGDWSHEGFAINLGVLFLIFAPLILFIVPRFFSGITKPKEGLDYQSTKDYLIVLSVFYLIGNTLFIILFRGGSLHCLFRFTLCSPFFHMLLFGLHEHFHTIASKKRLIIFSLLSILCLLTLNFSSYSSDWNFSDFGIFILIASMAVWLFQEKLTFRVFNWVQFILVIVNLIWTSYLFNSYLADSWIFA